MIHGNWFPVREIGSGSFGKVVHVYNIEDGREAAMKMERCEEGKDSMLKIEKEVMLALKGLKAAVNVFQSGTDDSGTYKFIIMTLCGMDLQKAYTLMDGKFTDSTITRIAIRSLVALKTVSVSKCHVARNVHFSSTRLATSIVI